MLTCAGCKGPLGESALNIRGELVCSTTCREKRKGEMWCENYGIKKNYVAGTVEVGRFSDLKNQTITGRLASRLPGPELQFPVRILHSLKRVDADGPSGAQYRAVCSCAWKGLWRSTDTRALDAFDGHVNREKQ